jgi:hypothetical protein
MEQARFSGKAACFLECFLGFASYCQMVDLARRLFRPVTASFNLVLVFAPSCITPRLLISKKSAAQRTSRRSGKK